MSNFALSTSDNYGDVIAGLNYALSNLGTFNADTAANVLVANTTTGEITTTSVNAGGYSSTTIVSYLYQYMDVKYANSSTGSSGFSSNSANKSYYGLYNTANTSISSNPADYQWYRVTGGFGTTKGLYYQTIGGRQVQFFPNVSAPTNSFIAVPDNTALNLDTVTSAQNNQIVNVNAYYQANIQPATPSGGTYNFTTFTLTAPSGWSANIPSSANTSVYVSSAAFTGNSSATSVPPATSWTVPALYTSSFQGNTGPAGARGFVPMGFVITASDPTTYSNTQFTTAYSSSRTNASPPIGLGFSPIQYDTSQFAYQNLFTGNTITVVKQYDGSGWTSVVGNVVSGGLFVPGSINANTLNANQVYALTIASTNANVSDFTSNGFWMQSSTGDARLAGTTSIGNNLIVGQNAQIGANLNVGTNATIGASLVVGQDAQIGANLNVGSGAIIGTNLTVGNNAVVGGGITIGADAQIGGNLRISGLVTGGNLNSSTVITTTIVNQAVSQGIGQSSGNNVSFNSPRSDNNTNSSVYYVYPYAFANIVPANYPSQTTAYVNANFSGYFYTANTATITAYGSLLLSRDGGATWAVKSKATYQFNATGGGFSNQYFYINPAFTWIDVPLQTPVFGNTISYAVGFSIGGATANAVTPVTQLTFYTGTTVAQLLKR
jgi:acetyltransferase-like isoleucine patch superfamily enzyme